MKNSLSRRQFFQRLTHDLSDQFNTAAVKKAGSIVLASPSEWITVAGQAEMGPGVEKRVIIENLSLTLRSNGEGVWASFEDGRRVALRVEAKGVIAVNPKVDWPPYRVLSHITGEAVDLVQD